MKRIFATRRSKLVAGTFIVLLSAEIGIYLYLDRAALSESTRNDSGRAEPTVAIGGPFSLVDQEGKAVTDRDFRGKWLVVYFGYTHCPDACPTALSELAAMMDALGPTAGRVQPLFVTVDPERDTQAVMKDYVSAFGGNIVGLTGTADATEAAAKAYRVYAAKGPVGQGGDYEVAHSSAFYVMDPAGRFARTFGLDMAPAAMAASLKSLDAQWRPDRPAKPDA